MRTALTLILMFPLVASAQQDKSGKNQAKNTLEAARSSKGGADKEQLYLSVDESSLQDGADVVAVYDELDKLSAEDKSAHGRGNAKASIHLLEVLARARKPEHHAAVKALLEKENSQLSPAGLESVAPGERDGLIMRTERLHSLMEAAGLGANTQALPVLRTMRKKGGQSGKMAETAIAQIGNDEDLDEFVREIKKDSKSRVNILEFGVKGYRRVVNEINDSSVPSDEKVRIAARLPKAVSREYLSETRALLKHENSRVVIIAADTIGGSVAADDAGLIREMLVSRNPAIRHSAILAIERLGDPRFVPDLLEVLKHGEDDWDRSRTAYILGKQKIRSATSVLQEVADSDASNNVRRSAKAALEDISK